MTEKGLIKLVSEQLGINHSKIKTIIRSIFNNIKDVLIEDPTHQIVIEDFGTFKIKLRKARTNYNIFARTKIETPAKNVVVFKPSKDMKSKICDLIDTEHL